MLLCSVPRLLSRFPSIPPNHCSPTTHSFVLLWLSTFGQLACSFSPLCSIIRKVGVKTCILSFTAPSTLNSNEKNVSLLVERVNVSTLLIFVLSIEIWNLKLRKDEKLWCMTWLLFMSWLNITSLLSHQTHLFAMFQQISTLSVISLSGCHIIGSITVATARNAASPPGALNFISCPEGCAGWEGVAGLYQSLSAHPDTTDCCTISPLLPAFTAGQVFILLHLTHQSDWLRKCITFVVFSGCCYEASYLFISNYATALTLYSLTIKSSRTVHFQQGLIDTSQIHPSIPMSREQSAF